MEKGLSLKLAKLSIFKSKPQAERDDTLALANSPAKILVPDLLVKIFMECVDIDTSDMFVPILVEPVLYLAHICSLWRTIAFSTPELCTWLAYMRIGKKDMGRQISHIKEFIKSCHIPLSFSIDMNDKAMTSILSLLTKHEWRLASISHARLKTLRNLSDRISLIVPSLQHFRLSFMEIEPSALAKTMVNKWEFPCLTKLSLTDLASYSGVALTVLIGRIVAPSLQTLNVECYQFDSQLVRQIRELVLRSGCSLLHLKLRGHRGSSHNPGDLASLLSFTPLLEELAISHIETDDFEKLCLHSDQCTEKPLVPSLKLLYVSDVIDRLFDYSMLNKLALSRCDFVTKEVDGSLTELDDSGCCRLEGILYTPSSYSSSGRVRHHQLEGLTMVETDPRIALPPFWQSTTLCNGPEMIQIVLNDVLISGIDDFYTFLESYPVPDPEFFQTSQLHLQLHDVMVGSMQWYPNRKFPERAEDILKKWEPMLKKCIPKRKWALQGPHITYIPMYSKLRESKHMLQIIYGLWGCQYEKFMKLRFHSGYDWEPRVQAELTRLGGGRLVQDLRVVSE